MTKIEDALAFVYRARGAERDAFGTNWCGPESYEHGKETLVARYPRTSDDGQDAEVFCSAWPARFYEVRVAATATKRAYRVGTGSGKHQLAADAARAVAGGMLGFHPEGKEE